MRYIVLLSHPIQYFSPLFAYLSKQGVELEVLYCNGDPKDQHFDAEFGRQRQWDIPLLEGYRYRFLKNQGFTDPAKKGFFSLFNPSVLSFLFKQTRSTLVIHSWQYATDWLAIIGGKLAGHRVALWTETNGLHESLQPRWKRLVKHLFFKCFFLLVNEYWYIGTRNREFYENLGVPARKLRFTPYSVDNERFRQAAMKTMKAEARVKLALPPGAFIILFVAKYIEKKRPLDLLEAFSALHHPNVFLLMVGEGALRCEMEDFISAHSLHDRVRLTGFVNQSEIPLHYRAADLFVMCSGIGETWGLSANEAMNFELPVLLSHLTGCSADLVEEGKNGYSFQTGNTGELAEKLERMLTLSKEEVESMGKESLRLLNKHSFQNILDGLHRGAREEFAS